MPRDNLPGEHGPGPEDTPSTRGGPRGRAQQAPHARRPKPPRRPDSQTTTVVTSTGGGPRGRAQRPRQVPAWVIQRQQVLRRLGYGAVVDGVWGQRSRDAWNRFLGDLRGQGTGGARQVPQNQPKAPLNVRRNLDFLTRQQRFDQRLGAIRSRAHDSGLGRPGNPTDPIGISPAGRKRLAQEAVVMKRHQEKWRLAKRNPILMRAYFGGRGQLPTGEASVPWGQDFITKDLGAEDVLGLHQRDLRNGRGLFLNPAQLGKGRTGIEVTPRTVALLTSWLRVRGVKLPRNPRSDQLNRALTDLMRRARHQEEVRHRTAVRKAYFDTGLAQQALQALGVPRGGTTMVGGDLVAPKGVPDLWTVDGFSQALAGGRMGVAPVLLKMAELQEKGIVDKNWEAWRQSIIAMGPILGQVSGGAGNFEISNPFLPDSIVKSDSEKEYDFRSEAERVKAYADAFQALVAAKQDYATQLSEQTGERYYFDVDLFIKNTEAGLADKDPGGRLGGIERAPGKGDDGGGGLSFIGNRLESLPLIGKEAAGKGVEATADLLAAANYPAQFVTDLVLGTRGWWMSGLQDAASGAGLQYVTAQGRHDAATGARIATTPGHFLGYDEAYAKGHVYREQLPAWALFIVESVFDPLNFVGVGTITRPIAGIRRWRQGVQLAKDVVEVGPDGALKYADSALPTGTAERQVGAIRAQLESKVDILDRVGQEVKRASRAGDYDDSLARTVGQIADKKRIDEFLARELMTAPFFANLSAHLQQRGVSLYRTLDRSDLSPTGVYVLRQMEQWMRGSVRRSVQKAFPELELPDFVVNGFGHGPIHPTVEPYYRQLVESKREWIEETLIPLMQDELMRRSPIQFDQAGKLVPTDAAVEFETRLQAFRRAEDQDRVEVPSHIFGQVFSAQEAEQTIRAEVDEIVSRRVTGDRLERPDLWLDDSAAGAAYRQQFVRQASEDAYAGVSSNWLVPGDRWQAQDILDELRARTTLAQDESAELLAAEKVQQQRQDAILDVAGEYLVLTAHLDKVDQGDDYLKGLFRWTNDELRQRFLDRHPNWDALGDLEELEKRRADLAIAFARDTAGLPKIDWTALSLRGKLLEKRAKHVVTVNAESWDAEAGTVLTRARQRKTIERATELFFEADLERNRLGRGTEARKALEDSIDRGLARVAGGHVARRKLLEGLKNTVVDTAEVVRLRTALEDLQRRYVRAARELEELTGNPDVPHSELRARGREMDDLKRQTYRASNAYFAELWSTADHGMLKEALDSVEAERAQVREMIAAGDGPRTELELLDRTLQIRARRLQLIVDLARNRRGLVHEMKPQTGQFAMRSAMIDNFQELTRLRRARTRADQLAKHYESIDLDRLITAAGKGNGGWMDIRPTISMPRSFATHVDTRAQNLAQVADEAESVAWMMHDQDFVAFPDSLVLRDSEPLSTSVGAINEAGDRVPRALVPSQIEREVDLPSAVTKDGPGSAAWALGELQRPNAGAAPLVSEGLRSTADRFRKLTPEAVASEAASVKRIADGLRQRQGIHKLYADVQRGKLLKQNGLWLASMKYSQALPVKGLYWGLRSAMQVWKTAVLPGSPGWVVLNYLDNTAKFIVEGILDPRLWINPRGKSFPEWGPLSTISRIARVIDRQLGTTAVGDAWERLVWAFYSQNPLVLDKLFGAHGLEFPKELMDGYVAHSMRVQGDDAASVPVGDWRAQRQAAKAARLEAEDLTRRALALKDTDPHTSWDLMQQARAKRREANFLSARSFHDFAWTFTAEVGEGRFRKAGYVHWYRKALDRSRLENPGWSAAEHQAFAVDDALANVDRVLFNPRNATALEDNLSILWPFVNFVKNNTKFWTRKVANDPWIVSSLDRYDEFNESNGDPGAPSWLERYSPTSFLGSLPLLSHLNDNLFKDGYFDPRNLVSLNLLWRSFKDQNDLLTDEQGGVAFLNLLASATNDVGLGMAPWVRKPLEISGLVAPEFWRDVFPQTTLAQSLDAKFFDKRWPDGLNLEQLLLDPLYEAVKDVDLSQLRKQDFDALVTREMAGQMLRDGKTDRAAAEKKVSDVMIVKNLWSWATHVYIRRVTAQDVWFYNQAEKMAKDPEGDTYLNFNDRQKLAYSIFKRRDQPVGALDKWVADQGMVNYYWSLEPAERDAFFALHPELIQYIGWRAREFTLNGEPTGAAEQHRRRQERRKRNDTLAARTDVVMNLATAMRTSQHNEAYRSIEDQWRDTLVTPELEDFWSRNDTPAEERGKMMQLEYDNLVDELHRDYYAIPKGDFNAKAAFLRANPLLEDVWRRSGVRFENGLPAPGAEADDLADIVNLFRRHARDYYFALMDAKGYDAAASFLRQHSDIFVGTKSANRISEPFSDQAVWLPSKRGDELSTKYLEAKPWLDLYFDQMERGGKDAARAVGANHPIVYEYFDLRRKWEAEGKVQPSKGHDGKVPQLTQHAKDYQAVKGQLDAYFALPKGSAARRAYADAHPELIDYFRKYSKGGGGRGGFYSHRKRTFARGWVNAQSKLDGYFDLPAGPARDAYLAKHPELREHVGEATAARGLGANRLNIARRYSFWMKFFALAPDEREAFVRAEAANHGVFVYGILGAQELYDNQQSGLAWQFAHGQLSRQQAYLMVKPLMDLWFSLPPTERDFYRQLNPEIDIYLRLYAKQKSLSGDPAIDAQIKAFFDIPEWEGEHRQRFLDEHPAVGRWFHSRGTPEERALSRLVDAYFKVPMDDRPEWLMMHPEVLSFFDVRSEQKDREDALGEVFDEVDPRLGPLRAEGYEDKLYAELIHQKLALAKEKPTPISVRREREFEERERADTT